MESKSQKATRQIVLANYMEGEIKAGRLHDDMTYPEIAEYVNKSGVCGAVELTGSMIYNNKEQYSKDRPHYAAFKPVKSNPNSIAAEETEAAELEKELTEKKQKIKEMKDAAALADKKTEERKLARLNRQKALNHGQSQTTLPGIDAPVSEKSNKDWPGMLSRVSCVEKSVEKLSAEFKLRVELDKGIVDRLRANLMQTLTEEFTMKLNAAGWKLVEPPATPSRDVKTQSVTP